MTATRSSSWPSPTFADRLHVTHSGARGSLIEIMDGSVDKGVGFREVATALGVELASTAAVGDMPNDIPMLRAAGTGYAVANAHPAARAAARHVLPSNEEDGVGQLLEALLASDRSRGVRHAVHNGGPGRATGRAGSRSRGGAR